jgi:hypothetical protein
MRLRRTISIASLFVIPELAALEANAKDACDFGKILQPDKVYVYLLHQQNEIYRKYDKDCTGKLTADQIAKYEAEQRVLYEGAQRNVERRTAAGKPVVLDKDGKTDVPLTGKIEPSDNTFPSGWHYLLRDSAEDVGLFISPKSFDSAGGATFGFSSDAITANTSWSAKGFASAAYYWTDNPPPDGAPYFKGYAIAPWVSFNRLTNSSVALASKQLNVLSLGLTGEADFGRVLLADQVFRANGALNADFDGKTRSWSATAEWQPVSNDYTPAISAPNPLGPFTWQVDPILRTQYTQRLNGSLDPIFVNSDQVWRVGPVVSLTIAPKKNDLVIPRWLQTTAFNLTYEWLINTSSGLTYPLLNTSLNLPVDPAGHFGLKINYQRGYLEQTGQQVEQATIGLGAKW